MRSWYLGKNGFEIKDNNGFVRVSVPDEVEQKGIDEETRYVVSEGIKRGYEFDDIYDDNGYSISDYV